MTDKIIVEFDREGLKKAACLARRLAGCPKANFCLMSDRDLIKCNLDLNAVIKLDEIATIKEQK